MQQCVTTFVRLQGAGGGGSSTRHVAAVDRSDPYVSLKQDSLSVQSFGIFAPNIRGRRSLLATCIWLIGDIDDPGMCRGLAEDEYDY